MYGYEYGYEYEICGPAGAFLEDRLAGMTLGGVCAGFPFHLSI